MILYSMTATFGKLSRQTLTLKEGLNVVSAPNEWGKSTWCAFLAAMLYGIDTRQKNTQTVIADKERYAPWNGEPMCGKIDLRWNGRNITIERTSTPRIPLGNFRAYETESGLEVPELTAANCGQMLLGVERNVFTRSVFVRLQDMPVTQDDALRRRLNNLVTTGDESGAGDRLGEELKELKNKCRYHNKGLLPQAEYEKEQLMGQLDLLEELQLNIGQCKETREKLEEEIRLLQNHQDTLRYDRSQQGLAQLAEAQKNCALLSEEVSQLQSRCDALPDRETAQNALQQGNALAQQQLQLDALLAALPQPPQQPDIPHRYRGIAPGEAVQAASEDLTALQKLSDAKTRPAKISLALIVGALLLAVGLGALHFIAQAISLPLFVGGAALGVIGAGMGVFFCRRNMARYQSETQQLFIKHEQMPPDNWLADAQHYAHTANHYEISLSQYQQQQAVYEEQAQNWASAVAAYTKTGDLHTAIADWEYILSQHEALLEKKGEYQKAEEKLSLLQSITATVPLPAFPDGLTLSEEETNRELAAARMALRQTEQQLGQYLGQTESIGSESSLRARLDSVSRRIRRLEAYDKALELAINGLHQATTALQRRFAPRINKKAAAYFSQLTGGRYQKLLLGDDFSVRAATEEEIAPRAVQWRSDGTIDQLYLALRLAVAEELIPQAPLVLDDALLRFDDRRLQAAMELLQTQAKEKQVILFTCQNRENSYISE